MENINCYQIENGDSSVTSIVFATSEENALKSLKESFDCETYESFEDYNEENDYEFANENDFEEWNYSEFYELFPKEATSITKIEQKNGLVITFKSLDL